MSEKKPKKKTTTGTPTPTKTDTLSRSVAADILKKHDKLKQTQSVDVPVGKFWLDYRMVDRGYFKKIQPLADKGFLTYGKTGVQKNSWWHEYFVNLSPEGEVEMKSWVKSDSKNPSYDRFWWGESPDCTIYLIITEEKKLVEITGIAFQPIDNSARVEFTWKWLTTEKGKSFFGKNQSDEIYNGTAHFQLYDDGWRIVLIN